VSLVGLGMLVTLLGNFRSAWLAMLGGMLYIFLYLPLRWRLLMLAWGSGVAVVAATVLALAWNVPVADGGSTLGEDLSQKMDVRSARFDPNVTWRFESYANAMALWAERPWLGQGLGVLTTFSAPTSTGGAQILYGHRVHNSLIWVLMTFGVVGAAVFAWWIGTVFWRFHWALVSNRLGLEDRTLVVACGAFVVSFLISTCFEIFLESGPPVLMLAAVLALGSAAAAEAHQQS
jgi:O-antigen ligase